MVYHITLYKVIFLVRRITRLHMKISSTFQSFKKINLSVGFCDKRSLDMRQLMRKYGQLYTVYLDIRVIIHC
jgi:uncharacterized Rmd1/YagE family protein